jgi:NADPH2:quinone reductase
MRAIVVNTPEDISHLIITDLTEPTPQKGQVLIDVNYAACNWMDTKKRRGAYPGKSMTFPLVLGNEVSEKLVLKI